MSFLEMLKVQTDSYDISTRQNLLLLEVNHQKKVTEKNWKNQKALLEERRRLIEKMKNIRESATPVIKETIDRLLPEQEFMYSKAMEEAEKFEARFKLKDGVYVEK